MSLLIAIVILAVLSATLIMLRINRRADTTNQQEDEDNDSHISGDVIDLRYYEGGVEDEDILKYKN